MRGLADKVAIVTGASRGIGYAVAERLVAEGAKVVITARKPDPLAEAVERLGAANAAFVAGAADDTAHQDEVIATALDRFGRLDLLVNNTGINPVYGPMIDLDLDAAQKILAVNVLAAVSWVQKVHAAALGASGGAIVNIGSVAGVKPSPGIGFYGVSKAALIRLTEEFAHELGPDIRVNSVSPAVVKTKFAGALFEGREEEVASAYPLKRLGIPEDIGSVVAFLLSEDSGWLTGQNVVIDGGITLTGGV